MSLSGPFKRPATPRRNSPHLSNSEEDKTHALAEAITEAGMAAPASVALRIIKPVSWVGGQLLWVLEPLLGTLGLRQTQNPFSLPGLASLLERESGVDDLMTRLDKAPDKRPCK